MNGVYIEKTHSKHIIIDTQERKQASCEFVLETTLMEKVPPHGQLALEFGPSNMIFEPNSKVVVDAINDSESFCQ
jgi:hypothetical protein